MKIVTQIITKHTNITIIIAIFVVLLGWMFFSDYGILERISLEKQIDILQTEITLQTQTTKTLENKIFTLRTDTLEIERIAREQYGMCKPNEIIYYIKK